MNILIVDDSKQKSDKVEAVVRSALNSGLNIERATCFIGATRKLEAVGYDILILDIVLPVRDGDTPDTGGGKRVLSEILEGSCRKPAHIIVLTQFKEAAPEMKEVEAMGLGHTVLYDATANQWVDVLVSKVRYVSDRLAETRKQPPIYRTDVLIVTSSPAVELKEVTNLPERLIAEYNEMDAIHYYRGNWSRQSGQKLSIVACAAPQMGMTAACATACKGIERWRPHFLVMTGIAAGTSKELTFGDVVVAETAYDYGSGKILDQESGLEFIPSPRQLSIDSQLAAILQRWEREQLKMDAVRQGWYRPLARTPRLYVGMMSSGAAVVQSRQLVDDILRTSRKVLALEMEAYGIFQAAQLFAAPRPRVLVAKSVSDFADKKKKDDWQHYAAYTSARFVYEFLTNAEELFVGSDDGKMAPGGHGMTIDSAAAGRASLR